jgi:hypothetical protein
MIEEEKKNGQIIAKNILREDSFKTIVEKKKFLGFNLK